MTKIFWDKGHGGTDPGAVGNGLQEKTLNHKIVEYGMKYLSDNYTGFTQKVSRAGDQTLSLKQRTDDARAWGADVILSVHINAHTNKAANGFESFIYNDNPSAATISFQNVLHAEVMSAMKAFGVITDRGKKRANFHMVREIDRSKTVACLTENLFIVNASDANKLKNEDFLKAVGEAHAIGVAKFLGLPKKEKQTMVNHTIVKGDTYWGLSREYKTTVDNLRKLNPGVDETKLQIGQKIRVK